MRNQKEIVKSGEKKGYVPPRPSFKVDFENMCKELNYKPNRANLKKKEGMINDSNQERTLYSGRGKGTL